MQFPIPLPGRPAALLLALALTPTCLFAAPAVTIGDKPREATTAEKLRKALDQTTSITIIDQPLEQAVNQLRDKTKINFVVDRAVLMMAQVDPSQQQPLAVKAENIKLRSILKSLLSANNLTYVIVGDTVLITTEDMAMYRQLKQRVSLDYDKVPLSKAIRDLSRETGTNLLVDGKAKKEAETTVSLQLDDVPLETALRLMSEMAGLKPVRMGNVLYVTTKANANELRQEPELAQPQPQPGMQQEMMWRGVGGFGGPGGAPVPILPPPPAPEKSDVPEKEKPVDKPVEKDKVPDKTTDKDKPADSKPQ